jgi:hypothetical protein
LTYESVCISLIEMNVILVIVETQNIHENKNMTWNLQKNLAIVDDMSDLKRLIIWSIHMNIHIVDLYVVNFKLNLKWHNKFCICIWTLLDEGTKFLIFTSLNSLVDLYFQKNRFELGMYEISCYLDVTPNTCCWIEILMQNR